MAEKNFWGEMAEEEYYASQGLRNSKEYFDTPQGKLFTQVWLPLDQKPKGMVCLTHGNGSETGWTFQIIIMAVAQMGFAAYAADMPGHGRSYGLPGYIPDFKDAAASLLHFYKYVRDRKENADLPHFLFGESMGGLMALLMVFQDPDGWDGIILSAPLIGIGSGMVISFPAMTGYKLLSTFFGTRHIAAGPRDHLHVVRDPERRKLIFSNPRRIAGPPRIKTRVEVERMSQFLSQKLEEVSVPFLVLHGTDDNVTDPAMSQRLYDVASSKDKTIKLYEGAYHSLIQGEVEETRAEVLKDLRTWLDERCKPHATV